MTEPTNWLTAEEQAAWRGYLAMLRHVSTSIDRQLQDDAGLPHGYYQILAMLSEAPDRTLRMSRLAEVTMTSQSRISHAVKALEDRGWVQRAPSTEDRRGHTASLTDSGFAALVELAPGHVAAVRRLIFDRLSPEQIVALKDITDSITKPNA
ncbi:MAG: MarR family transcriptional regulator [Pseudonocardiales bacterium]|nr:MarR family transcriptional regulator [Jatrophihabitantaceae bacterium]MCW2602100.1 MarR family transcriptional regulator [Pseudonocardiales bacterium]